MKTGRFFAAAVIGWAVISSISFGYDWSTNPGDGSLANPYQISEPNHLISIGTNTVLLDKCFILMNDIDLNPSITGIGPFSAALIGRYMQQPFKGKFDGQNFTIDNLTMIINGLNGSGLFGAISRNGQVKNLNITNVNIADTTANHYYTGGLAGSNEGMIINCHVTGNIQGKNDCGGITGVSLGSIAYPYEPSQIIMCTFQGQVIGKDNIGGIVGSGDAVNMSYCISDATVNGANYCGEIIGQTMGSILFACIAKGKVICSSASAGGIAGANGDHCGFGGEISSCYSHASVECNQYAGGFIGQNMGYGKIIKSYSTGEVNYDPSISSNVGGFAGRHSSGYGQLLNCYFLNTAGPNNGYGIPLDDPNMMIQSNYIGWDFTNETVNGANDIWRMCVNNVDYPRLNWESIGDFTCPDGVAIEDLDYFVGRWLLSNCTSTNNYCGWADVNSSGKVDLTDFAVLAEHWLEGV